MKKNIVETLISWQTHRLFYPLAHGLLSVFSLEIPREVKFGKNVHFVHRAPGTVIHPSTRIGDNVQIYQGVTIGVTAPWNDEFGRTNRDMYRIDIQKNSILCAGCKVLAKERLTIGEGSIVGANAVLTQSIGNYEIWAGIPAKCIGKRIIK